MNLCRVVFIALLIMTSVGLVNAHELSFEVPENDLNPKTMSINSSSVLVTELHADFQDDEEFYVTPDEIGNYTDHFQNETRKPYYLAEYQAYNESDGTTFETNQTLEYQENIEAWILEFEPNTTQLEEINLHAEMNIQRQETDNYEYFDRSDVIDDIEITENKVSFENAEVTEGTVDFGEPLTPGLEDINMEVEVMNMTSGSVLTDEDVSVEIYYSNLTDSFENQNFGEFSEGLHLTQLASIPDKPNDSMVKRIVALEDGSIVGTESRLVNTAQILEGEIAEISSDGCNSHDDYEYLPEDCEPDSNISASFNITSAEAESVNMTLEAYNQTSDQFENVTELIEMNETGDESGQIFDASVHLPDLNTSTYQTGDESLRIEFTAENNLRTASDSHLFGLETFEIVDDTRSTITAGQEYKLETIIRKPFSRDIYDEIERFDVLNVTIESENNDFNKTFSREELEYDASIPSYTAEFLIPEGEEHGPYTITTEVTDKFNETKIETKGISVVDPETTFTAQEEINLNYSYRSLFNETIEVSNAQDESRSLETDTDIDSIILDDSYSLEEDEDKELDFQVNMTELEEDSGEIILEDESGFMQQVEVEINTVDCSIEVGNICSLDDIVDISTVSESQFIESVEIVQLLDNTQEVNLSLEGNASQISSVSQNKTLEPGLNTVDIEVNPVEGMSYLGNLSVSSTEGNMFIPIEGDVDLSDEDEQDIGLNIEPEEATASAPEAESDTLTFDISNSGDIEIEEISLILENHDIDTEEFSLMEEDSESVDLAIEESDTLNVTGQTDIGSVSESVEINFEVMDNYDEKSLELEDEIIDLRAENDDPSIETELTELMTQAENVRTQWNSGDYTEAQQEYNSAHETLNNLRNQVESQSDDSAQENGSAEQNGSDEGGIPIIPIIAILVVLTLIGAFVFYESYMPEEGDPLYGVMGE